MVEVTSRAVTGVAGAAGVGADVGLVVGVVVAGAADAGTVVGVVAVPGAADPPQAPLTRATTPRVPIAIQVRGCRAMCITSLSWSRG